MHTCKLCDQPLTKKQILYKGKFCSKSHMASYNNKLRLHSNATKTKISNTMKKKISAGEINPSIPNEYLGKKKYDGPYCRIYGPLTCNHCNKLFYGNNPNKVCCSVECRDSIRSQNKCRKTQIEYYKNGVAIILQSSWELEIAKWLDYNTIDWSRPAKRLKWYDDTMGKNRTYLPDFYLTEYDIYLDVKNPIKMEQDSDKISQLIKIFNLFVGNIENTKKYVEGLIGIEPTCVH